VKSGRGHEDGEDHHDGERIVVLAELPTRFEAYVAAARQLRLADSMYADLIQRACSASQV
jgi:hypothetical protein